MSAECCSPEESPTADERTAPASESVEASRPPWWRDAALLPSAIAGVLLIVGTVLEWTAVPIAAVVLHSIALLIAAWAFVPGAVRRLLRGRLGVGLLMTIAALGAVLLGRVGEAAALAFLFALAEALEDRAMDRAKEGLRALLSLLPETARVARGPLEVVVPASAVREHDILVIGAGERIPTDGTIIEGRSSIDVSPVTGESIPIAAGPGDAVFAGTVNGAATLRVQATAGGRDNSLTRVVELVEHAQRRKGQRARLADRIARPLVPGVLGVAALVAVIGGIVDDPSTWIERALVVLVAASPCALAIAVPVTVVSAIGAASRLGVVIKSGAAFERLGTIRTIAFDKTGTLTRNAPSIIEVRAAIGVERSQVLALAAAVEGASTHPLATAILAAAPGTASADAVVERAGYGVEGVVDGSRVRVGSARWVDPRELGEAEAAMARRGMTVVVVEADRRIVGLIGVRDELRPEAGETIRLLAAQGIDAVMLTGDNARTAVGLAQEAGIVEVHAEQLPVEKASTVSALVASRPTAMVGDGINDAPALATATVGIAMGLTGAAAAMESADVVFTGRDLRLIPAAFAHARRGRRIMAWNLALALAIIVVLLPLALFGVLGLAGVVLVHELAEVVVILNGVRGARPQRTAPRPPAVVVQDLQRGVSGRA